MKLKHLQTLNILPGSYQIGETLFRRMLATWTKLEVLQIYSLHAVGQHLLDQMPGQWANLRKLLLGEKPEDLQFVTKFKNLRQLAFESNLPREETVFLMRTCPSLYHMAFHNESTELVTFLHTGFSLKDRKSFTVLPGHIHSDDKYRIQNFCERGIFRLRM